MYLDVWFLESYFHKMSPQKCDIQIISVEAFLKYLILSNLVFLQVKILKITENLKHCLLAFARIANDTHFVSDSNICM